MIKARRRKETGFYYGRSMEEETNGRITFIICFLFFKDVRYLKKDGRPLFIIYKPEDIRCLNEMMQCWNELMEKEGMPRLYFIGKDCLLDGELCHEPQNALTGYGSRRFDNAYGISNIVGFDEAWNGDYGEYP